jgi:hypothetical protein
MTPPLPFRVIPCGEWGAAQARGKIPRSGKPARTIFHHTAGHHPDLDGVSPTETYGDAVAYAKTIQRSHFNNGWVDSGHNFLITRNGYILEGRHGSLAAVKAGVMVVSAHCPGQNGQPGIEHEQIDPEQLTPIQREASVWLHAELCRWCPTIKPANTAQPHRRFAATACPGTLTRALPALRRDIAAELAPADKVEPWYDKYGPKRKPAWFFKALREYQRRLGA